MSSVPATSSGSALAAAIAEPSSAEVSPLDAILNLEVGAATGDGRLAEFLESKSLAGSLRGWFGPLGKMTGRDVARRLSVDIATIDAVLNAQLNEILHHPAFQKLEASWRSLQYLTECAAAEGEPTLKIKVLQCSWRELERDVELASEFDQSQLFRKVYDDHFGMPGGEPIGLLIGDYEIHPTVSPSHPHDDVSVLGKIAGVAAAAFCPFVASASPAMFGLDDFGRLEALRDLERDFSSPSFLRWRALRDSDDARFVGLALPRVIMRTPYADDGSRADGFRFVEDVAGPDRAKYLWGNAAYAFGETVIRAYADGGWFTGMRGVQRGVQGGGLVCHLPAPYFDTDRSGIAPQGVADVVITDQVERELARMGFIPLCQCHDSELVAFYSCQSIQKPKPYAGAEGTQNASISAMLHYMFCVSRFAHYLKVLARDKIGSFQQASDCQRELNNWIAGYVMNVSDASSEQKSRYPLREARVEVVADPTNPGHYLSTFYLRPHFELDDLTATISFRTQLAPPGAG